MGQAEEFHCMERGPHGTPSGSQPPLSKATAGSAQWRSSSVACLFQSRAPWTPQPRAMWGAGPWPGKAAAPTFGSWKFRRILCRVLRPKDGGRPQTGGPWTCLVPSPLDSTPAPVHRVSLQAASSSLLLDSYFGLAGPSPPGDSAHFLDPLMVRTQPVHAAGAFISQCQPWAPSQVALRWLRQAWPRRWQGRPRSLCNGTSIVSPPLPKAP